MKVFALILSVKAETTLELNSEKLTVDVLRNQVSTLPVIGESERDKAVIGEDGGELLIVEVLLLPCV